MAGAVSNSRLRPIFGRGSLAGNRGPDASCRLFPAGTPTTLSEQARACWALLFFGGAECDQRSCVNAARSRLGDDLQVFLIWRSNAKRKTSVIQTEAGAMLEDHLGDLARAYHAKESTAILIRPDGHVAWRSPRPEVEGMMAWLCQALNDNDGSGSKELQPVFATESLHRS